MWKALRNVAIIFAIAGIVYVVPGGSTAATTITQAVWLAFLASLAWFAIIMYRQHRSSIYSLGDRRRASVYIALGVAALTLTATSRLWDSAAGSVAWLVLMGAAVYAVAAAFIAARR